MKYIHNFDTDICNQILNSRDSENYHYLSTKSQINQRDDDFEIVYDQPLDAHAWEFTNQKILSTIQNLIENSTNKKVNLSKGVIQKYNTDSVVHPHYDGHDITSILLLNKQFTGGNLNVKNQSYQLSLGDLVIFESSEEHYVEKLESGERYVLVTWFDYLKKNKQTLI
jgi:hypothetical protein